MTERLSIDAIARGLVRMGVPKEKARAEACRHAEALTLCEQLLPVAPVVAPEPTVSGSAASGRRLGDRLWLQLPYPPRTKKNGGAGGFAGIRQRPAYRKFRAQVVAGVAALKSVLQLPLPLREYNIAATYYVDVKGEAADKCGLDQGLYDALQNAGVITDDWYFRTDDGTRIIAGDSHPRVELTITPIQEGTDGRE